MVQPVFAVFSLVIRLTEYEVQFNQRFSCGIPGPRAWAGRQGHQGEQRLNMSEIDETPRSYSGALLGAIALALLCAIGGLIWAYTLTGRIARQEAALAEANHQNTRLAADLRET